jgi:hypothetical protein
MHSQLLEVKSAVLNTWDGEAVEVHGGAYLPPEAFLTANAELERLRERAAERTTAVAVGLVLGGALLGFAVGYQLARRRDD